MAFSSQTMRPFYLSTLMALAVVSILDLESHQSAILLVCIAGVLSIASQKKGVVVPLVAFIGVAYVIGYAVPALWPVIYADNNYVPSDYAVTDGMQWAVRGFAAFSLGYIIGARSGSRKRVHFGGDALRARRHADYVTYMFLSIGWLALLGWITSGLVFGVSLVFIEGAILGAGEGTFNMILNLFSMLRYPFFLGMMLLYMSNRPLLTRTLRNLFIALLGISIIEIIIIGSKQPIILIPMLILIAFTIAKRRFSWKQFVTGILALLLINGAFSVITEYRAIMQEHRDSVDVISFSVQLESFTAALLRSFPLSGSYENRLTVVDQSELLSRFGSGLFSFANLLASTGEPPYQHAGESFLIPLYALVPRVFFPNKPVFFNSGSNASEYYDWTYGGISVTLLGSLYYAWGYWGLVLGMAFVGILFGRIIEVVMKSGIDSPKHLIILVLLLIYVMDVGSTFHAISTNYIRLLLLLWLLERFYFLFFRRKVKYHVGGQR